MDIGKIREPLKLRALGINKVSLGKVSPIVILDLCEMTLTDLKEEQLIEQMGLYIVVHRFYIDPLHSLSKREGLEFAGKPDRNRRTREFYTFAFIINNIKSKLKTQLTHEYIS